MLHSQPPKFRWLWLGPACLFSDQAAGGSISHSAQINNRTEIRERYGIRGDTCGDCLASWLCRCCALTQERRELELEEGSFE